MRGGKRVDDGDIDGKASTETGFIGNTKNSQLLQFGSEEPGVSELEYQISQAIVSRNSVAGLIAA